MSIRLTIAPSLIAGLLAVAPVMAQTASTATSPSASAPTATPATPATKATPATASAATAPAATPGTTRRDAMVERRITELHSKLKITAAEQKPFDDFAQAMRDSAATMDAAMSKRQAATPTATAPEQMKSYADMAQAHADDVAHLVGPFSKLYDALSPDQKKMADQSFREFSNGPRGRQGARS